MDETLNFGSGSASVEKLRAFTNAEWRGVIANPEVAAEIRSAGIAVDELPAEGVFEIRAGSSGFDVSSTDVVVAVGVWAVGVVGEAAKGTLLEIWRKRVQPRILDRLGDDAIGKEKD